MLVILFISYKFTMKIIIFAAIAFLPLFLAGCGLIKNKNTSGTWDTPSVETSQNVVEKGDTVSVDYIGKLEDGTLFDTSIEAEAKAANKLNEGRTYEPLTFIAGAGQMIPGFDAGVLGMKTNETKKLTLAPDQAYGNADDPKYNVPMNIETFKVAGIEPKVGESYDFGGQRAKVISISGTTVTASFAPELAGKTLIFEITVKNINKGS